MNKYRIIYSYCNTHYYYCLLELYDKFRRISKSRKRNCFLVKYPEIPVCKIHANLRPDNGRIEIICLHAYAMH